MPWLVHVVAIGSLSRASQELRFGLRLLLGALGNDQRDVMTWNLAARGRCSVDGGRDREPVPAHRPARRADGL